MASKVIEVIILISIGICVLQSVNGMPRDSSVNNKEETLQINEDVLGIKPAAVSETTETTVKTGYSCRPKEILADGCCHCIFQLYRNHCSASSPDNRIWLALIVSEHNHPGRVSCQYDEAAEDPVCQEHCLPKGYSYGICTSYTCSCI